MKLFATFPVCAGLLSFAMSHSFAQSNVANSEPLKPKQAYQFSAFIQSASAQPSLRLWVGEQAAPETRFDDASYYRVAQNLTGATLKTALFNVISGHQTRGYGDLWQLYAEFGRDQHYDKDSSILDIYSEVAEGADPYNFRGSSQQCRGTSINREGVCYNREHVFPRSWFDDEDHPAFSDAHHIVASDAYVNSMRSNFPHGDVNNVDEQSLNGSQLGSSASNGFSGTVFEPIDEFKGDIARMYFYMATRYQNEIASWRFNNSRGTDVLDGSDERVYEAWFVAQLLAWHRQDPVNEYEQARNEAVYQFQANRNPFIDHPEWVEQIW